MGGSSNTVSSRTSLRSADTNAFKMSMVGPGTGMARKQDGVQGLRSVYDELEGGCTSQLSFGKSSGVNASPSTPISTTSAFTSEGAQARGRAYIQAVAFEMLELQGANIVQQDNERLFMPIWAEEVSYEKMDPTLQRIHSSRRMESNFNVRIWHAQHYTTTWRLMWGRH